MAIKAKLLSKFKDDAPTFGQWLDSNKNKVDFRHLAIWVTLGGTKKCREQIFANGHILKKKFCAGEYQYIRFSELTNQYKDWVVKYVYATPVWSSDTPELLEGLSISLVQPKPVGLLLTNDELRLLDTCLSDCTGLPYLSKDYVARVNALRKKIKNNL